MGSEMGDAWRDIKAGGQARRAANRADSPNLLKAAGIAFESKNGGAHLIVTHDGEVVDFWPGTGKWIVRGGKKGRGVRNLIRRLVAGP